MGEGIYNIGYIIDLGGVDAPEKQKVEDGAELLS